MLFFRTFYSKNSEQQQQQQKRKITVSTKILHSSTSVLNIDNKNKCFLLGKSAY